jgi:hypothetical protein
MEAQMVSLLYYNPSAPVLEAMGAEWDMGEFHPE